MNATELHMHLVSPRRRYRRRRWSVARERGARQADRRGTKSDCRPQGGALGVTDSRFAGHTSDLVKVPRIGVLPLSFFQERLWILHRLDPHSIDYNMVMTWPAGTSADAIVSGERIRDVPCGTMKFCAQHFVKIEGAPLVKILPDEAIAIEIKYLNDLDEKQH